MKVSNRRAKSTAVERRRWAAKYFRSRLSQREFALKQGLRLSTLQRWVAQNRRTMEVGGLESLPGPGAAVFAEVKLPPSAMPSRWMAEVIRADGSVLRLANDIAPALLDQLLGPC